MAAILVIAAPVAEGQVRPAGQERPPTVRRIAVLPVENLSGVRAPLAAIKQLVTEQAGESGLHLVEEDALATFMRAHRLRYTGGVSLATAKACREEIDADAVLITSLETFREGPRPKVTLHARLVSAGDDPTILWSDSIGLAGDEAPGLLGLGLITDPQPLLQQEVRFLVRSLIEAGHDWLAGSAAAPRAPTDQGERRARPRGRSWRSSPYLRAAEVAARYDAQFRPRTHFRSDALDPGRPYAIAVIPFLNVSERKYADTIVALHFVEELRHHRNVTVVEPGMVRERLLATRSIMIGGPSLAVADLFFHQEFPRVDLILSGEVFDYQDREQVPKVDFSLQVFEKTTRQVVWFSRSFNQGDEDVAFFDLGRQHTAHALVTRMARSAIERMLR